MSPDGTVGQGPAFPMGLEQPLTSMRFSVDSLLLPCFVAASLKDRPLRTANPRRQEAFCPEAPGKLACADLGCGCGASSIALLKLADNVKIYGVDREEELVLSARRNAGRHAPSAAAVYEQRDVADLASVTRPFCDLVLSNPPYWEEGAGYCSPRAMNDRARRSRNGLPVFLRAARQLLVHHGRLYLIYPAARMAELAADVMGHGFGVRRLRAVRSFAGQPAVRVLMEAVRGAASDVVWEPDLVLYERSSEGVIQPDADAVTFCPWLRRPASSAVSRET